MRGYQKRIVFLKHTGSRIFDEAYFLVNPSCENENENDMVLEANRIIEDNITKGRDDKKGAFGKSIFPFLLGVAAAGIVFAIGIFIFLLLSNRLS